MQVQINPERLAADKAFRVLNPANRRPFPAGPFELTAEQLRDPRIIRLLPPRGQLGGVAGGVHADLVPIADPAAEPPAKPKK